MTKKIILYSIVILGLLTIAYYYFEIPNYLLIKKVQNGKVVSEQELCNIYIYDNKMWYLWKKNPQLLESNTVFLHYYPADTNDLPLESRPYSMDNYDFELNQKTIIKSPSSRDYCLIFYREGVPTYKIQKVQTGIYNSTQGRIWQTDLIELK